MKRYRNEWKYIVSDKNIANLRGKLTSILPLDSHSNFNGIYVIHNIYFDDYKNTCAFKTEKGDYERYKWRIRYYGEDITSLRLELKEKLYGRCHKETCKLSYTEYKAIMNGDTSIMWNTTSNLLKRFCMEINTRCFKPKVIVEYEREAYVDELLNIRITFDRNISCSYEFNKFLEGNYIKYPIQDRGVSLVEVKFDNILPSYIKNIVTRECKVQQAFSKYYQCLRMLEVLR